jgi:hypothetical protein
VMEYQLSLKTTISDVHILGLLLDPIHKDEIADIPFVGAEQVRGL